MENRMESLLLGFAVEQCIVFAVDWLKRVGPHFSQKWTGIVVGKNGLEDNGKNK